MDLDLGICSEARQSRDARFDGHIFIAIASTGIYCRPICPSRAAREENVHYFATAAAAAEAGFRPCLRCRPECSPGIRKGPFEDQNRQAAAGRTRRLHFAKRLLDETSLSMEHIALAAGFERVERFVTTIRSTYGRPPSQIRKHVHRSGIRPENEYVFALSYRPPLEWDRMLGFLALRAIPGVEEVEASRYRRTISLGGQHGSIEACLPAGKRAVRLRICVPDPRWLLPIMERARYMFDLNADPLDIAGHLGTDPLLRASVATAPGLRVPGCWDGFELAVRAILGQQVTVKGASTLAGRLAREFGTPADSCGGLTHLFPTPAALAQADLAHIGLPAARAETIRGLASAVCEGRVSFSDVDPGDFAMQLRTLPGIGDWTAQYIAMRACADPDAFPSGDLGLLRAAGISRPRELAARSEAWRPWRAYAAMHLWLSLK